MPRILAFASGGAQSWSAMLMIGGLHQSHHDDPVTDAPLRCDSAEMGGGASRSCKPSHIGFSALPKLEI
jgi:hypothetical protein